MGHKKYREKGADAIFHVSNSTNNGEFLFEKPEHKKILEDNILKMMKKYPCIVINYVIMSNHFHMQIKPGAKQDISRMMQWLLSVTARQLNKKLGRKGHVWGDRFWSDVIKTTKDFYQVFKYINRNPVKAGLVDEAGDWRYGALYHVEKGDMRFCLKNPQWMVSLFRKSWAR